MSEKIDLRIQKTYMALHNAFNALLEEKRFEDLTVNELCDRAMIRRTTFYKHFADKYEYFSFYIRENMEAFQGNLAIDIERDDIDAYLAHMCHELLRFMKEHDLLVRNIQKSTVFPILLNIMIEQITRDLVQILKGSSMKKSQAEGIAAFYAGGLANILFRNLKQGSIMDEEEIAEIISRFVIK